MAISHSLINPHLAYLLTKEAYLFKRETLQTQGLVGSTLETALAHFSQDLFIISGYLINEADFAEPPLALTQPVTLGNGIA